VGAFGLCSRMMTERLFHRASSLPDVNPDRMISRRANSGL